MPSVPSVYKNEESVCRDDEYFEHPRNWGVPLGALVVALLLMWSYFETSETESLVVATLTDAGGAGDAGIPRSILIPPEGSRVHVNREGDYLQISVPPASRPGSAAFLFCRNLDYHSICIDGYEGFPSSNVAHMGFWCF